jgi:hypothetical protein
VETAFEDAKAKFEADSADDPRMLELTLSKTNFNEVSTLKDMLHATIHLFCKLGASRSRECKG